YDTSLRPITAHSKEWFQDALTNVVQASETVATRAFTRPIAENILTLVISPQVETTGNTGTQPYSIAPNYLYDSTLITNPGATISATNPQGTRHLLPPMLKVTMVALDERSGEFLARKENDSMRKKVLDATSALFKSASNYASDLAGTDKKPGTLEQTLIDNKLTYRVFTTTIALRQARWSF
ncbi:MAG: hypothetical protein ABL962_18925, partial [Fimbriimonadaceae bacterium]